MIKRITAVIIAVILCLAILSGCDNTSKRNVNGVRCIDSGIFTNFSVYYDEETRVMYLAHDDGGVCVMLNADGTPKLYRGE